MNAMRFRAKYVSASEDGDYYQVAFENTDPAGDTADVDGLDSPYLLICETPDVLRDLDSWIRRRLRSVLWKQWKVFKRRKAELIKRGVGEDLAHPTA